MKRIICLLAIAITLTSCGTVGLGPGMGAMVGGTLGSIAGDATGTRYGSSLGGMIGSVAGMAVGAAIDQQQYKERMEKAAQQTQVTVVSAQPVAAVEYIDLNNFIYTDSNNNDTIEVGENCQISFEVGNPSDQAITNITPILELVTENKGIKIGKPTTISKLSAHSKVTYSVPVIGNSHLKDGEVQFRAYVTDSKGNTSDSREFTLATKK